MSPFLSERKSVPYNYKVIEFTERTVMIEIQLYLHNEIIFHICIGC